ncbi:MAG TPA: GNAT family N-acetyltransferase [Gemmatimonadaceae bacterium]|nr:GNAT family N-acetyltransferase [Gemmatimonadaceae bacterium]
MSAPATSVRIFERRRGVEITSPELRVRFDEDAFQIRRATPADAGALSRAAATFFTDTFGAANRAEDLETYLGTAFSELRQRTELSDSNSRIWLATIGEDILGYAHVRLARVPSGKAIAESRHVEIARIYADHRWHGRGLGGALMSMCVGAAREWGPDVLWLGVWEKNPRAIAFYEKHGFQVIGDQPFLLGADLQRDLVMARRLTNDR